MATKTHDVIQRALRLTPAQRARVAERLLSSLEPQSDPGVEVAWQREVDRRLSEVRSGKVRLVSWETVRRRLREKMRATG